MIQLTASGPRIVKDSNWTAQQREFAQHHCVVLKDFVDEPILNRLRSMLERGRYCVHEHLHHKNREVIAKELVMLQGEPLVSLFVLLLNQPRLFKAIAEFTGCEKEICSFDGRLYKRIPNNNHFNYWHNDLLPGRLCGLSIDLSQRPVEGSAFQMRDEKTGSILRTIPPVGFGNAILFRIHRFLKHKVSLVRGAEPRYACTGWFCGKEGDYSDAAVTPLRGRELRHQAPIQMQYHLEVAGSGR